MKPYKLFLIATVPFFVAAMLLAINFDCDQGKEEVVKKQAERIVGFSIQNPHWFYFGSGNRIIGFDFQVEQDWFYTVDISNGCKISTIRKTPMPGNHESPVILWSDRSM